MFYIEKLPCYKGKKKQLMFNNILEYRSVR